MEKNINISIFEVVGSPLCVASDDGHKVYDRLVGALSRNMCVSLSFRNVSTLTSAFLNTAIGQLYGEFNENQIRELLKVEDIEPDDVELLKHVVVNAKQYFENKSAYEKALADTTEN